MSPTRPHRPTRWAFYRNNARWLAVGVMLAFGSSIGQTWFISLFAGEIRATHGLSDGDWGLLYMAATLCSAALLSRAGALVDHAPLRPLVTVLVALLACAAIGLAYSTSLVALFFAVLGLRFAGQGMMSHTAFTAMGRAFAANRGKAVAVTVLGFPLGEALLPPIIAAAKLHIAWQQVLTAAALILAALLIPVLLWALSKPRAPQGEGSHESFQGLGQKHWSRAEMLRHRVFWMLVPVILTPPFIGTVLFFHQAHIGAVKGWPLTVMAFGITLYAATTVLVSLITGWLIDRFGLPRLLPFLLMPLAVGMAWLALPGPSGQWFGVLVFSGVTHGMASTLYGALWPTLYGTRNIGAIRAVITSSMVFATAAGPGITGLAIDWGVDFPTQAGVMALICVGLSVLASLAARQISRAL